MIRAIEEEDLTRRDARRQRVEYPQNVYNYAIALRLHGYNGV